jgi:hypothetical protein
MGGGSSKKAATATATGNTTTGPLSTTEINSRITGSTVTETFRLDDSNVAFRYAVASQRGYYPDGILPTLVQLHTFYLRAFSFSPLYTLCCIKRQIKKIRIALLSKLSTTAKEIRHFLVCLMGMDQQERNARALQQPNCQTNSHDN